MSKISILSRTINNFFNDTANKTAVSCGFIKRKRKLDGSSFIKALVFGNLQNSNCSIENMCSILYDDNIDITKQGLDFRFQERSVDFMSAMFKESMSVFHEGLKINCDILKQFASVKLLDSTCIKLPETMESQYKGCGGAYKDRKCTTKAVIKLQLVFDYINQKISKLDIKEGVRADQGYKDYLQIIQPNELWIADLGYFVPSSFKSIINAGAYFISRYKTDTNVYNGQTGVKIDLLEYLQDKSFIDEEVYLGKEAKIKVRIIARKLLPEQSLARRKKANKLAKSRGYKSSEKNQKLLNWSIFITNISKDKIEGEYIMQIYKARWQIELLFKLYKSGIQIEKLKAKTKSYRVLCELYAKLCSAIIFHGLGSLISFVIKEESEISLTKALTELRRRAGQMLIALKTSIKSIEKFFNNLVASWIKFSLKDKNRKRRLSTMGLLKSLSLSLT